MAKTMILNLLFITYATVVLSLISMSKSDPFTDGFSIDLIHRDSPKSPSYDPSLTPSQRLLNAFQRSFHRVHRFKRNASRRSPESGLISAGGEYLLTYSVGTPPVSSLGIADTGSDIIWTQCLPCIKCFKQQLPIFRPHGSTTYKRIPCKSPKCISLEESFCSKRKNNCLYAEQYGDGSFTEGELARDTITFASSHRKSVSLPNITFGCGFRNGGLFSGSESGIIGLGGGQASLVRQLGRLAQGKFSYCLVALSDNANSSKLHFGSKAKLSGRGVVSTPIVRKDPETFYYLTLEGISVGNQKLEFHDPLLSNNSKAVEEGNIIIDSGTTLTLLPPDFYDKLVNALKRTIKLKQIPDPQGFLDLCYFSKEDAIKIPDITVHFKGADVKWKQDNAFVRTGEDALCFAAQGVFDLAIYGNLAQANFLVGYDLEKGTVSFKATDCGQP
ncbi:Aspartyl protease [Handroanthus impetiginosus]|uniref:Aspartyl protease n=1 Tax=Handroanthus impetiginosus TaxID=429701 RepID=A0A2G9I5W8_9LAMI|nr:Aspartyl protease [Handroanthus impetiginosus]PIN25157.1 Aspartyl protease [Handroanthus impetiginosus]